MAQAAQIKLKNSLAKKKSSLPKLKNILASPFPRYWPNIDDDDVKSLEELIFADKKANDSEKYMCNRGIHLGLKSCLRSIKNTSTQIVLLSTEIKPSFIISQIINFSLSREKPIFILLAPNVKEITKKLFGIESLALTSSFNKFESLEKWFKAKAQKFPIPEKLKQYFGKNSPAMNTSNTEKNLAKIVEPSLCVNFEKLYVLKSNGPFVPENSKHLKPLEIDEQNNWTGLDFISFSDLDNSSKQPSTTNVMRNKEDDDDDFCDYKTDRHNLLQIIKKHFENTKNNDSIKNNEYEKMDVDKPKDNELAVSYVDPQPKLDGNKLIGQIITKSKKNKNKLKGMSNTSVNYMPMKVHKIQGNPNKRKKNKKTKKK